MKNNKRYKMRSVFLAIIFFLFSGCDGKVITMIYDKSKVGENIQSIEISATNNFSKKVSEQFLKEQGFFIKESAYRLRVEYRYYAQTCNNPMVKTSGNYDYDGFVKITLLYKGSQVYASQRDFRGKINTALITNLIDGMIDDLKIKK